MSNEMIKPRNPLDLLTDRERQALQVTYTRKEPALGDVLQGKLFELYLTGRSCEEIRKINTAVTLGQIVRARIEYDWDARRREHFENVLDGVAARVLVTRVESINFLADLLTATNKMVGGKIREYLVTGNPDSLNGVPLLTSTKAYKEAVETLMKVTGLDQTKSELTKGIPEDQLPDSKASVTLALSDDGQSELLKMLETQLKNGSE